MGNSGVTGAPSLSSSDTAASSVGTYAITAALGTLAAQNYTFGFASGVLSVTPATLTVTANTGQPALRRVRPGLQRHDHRLRAESDLGRQRRHRAPSLSSSDTAASSVGTYAITAALGTLAAQNYTFGFASGVLSVTPATLTVSANNAGRLYGASDPAYSDTITGFVLGQTLGNSGVTGAEPLQQRHGRQLGGHLRDHRRFGHPGRAELHLRLRQRRLERHPGHLDGLCQ